MIIFIIIILVHWIADFIFQSVEMANNKSKSNSRLLDHTLIYTFIWWIALLALQDYLSIDLKSIALFAGITFLTHTATDYVTSRIVSKKFKKGEYGTPIPNTGGFTVIGFDQVLHYMQLLLTWKYMFGGI